MIEEIPAETIPCPQCGSAMQPVHRCSGEQPPVLRGWFCAECGTFSKAVYRESHLGLPDKGDGNGKA